jgi:hypothetical protein
VLARQARTTRLTATAVLAAHRHGARAGLAVMGSEGNTVGLELRGRRAVAWRADDGRRSDAGAVRARRSRVVLRIAVGRRVRLAVRTPKGWRRVGRPQAQPRWAAGARIALIVRGGRAARAQFDSLSVEPRK